MHARAGGLSAAMSRAAVREGRLPALKLGLGILAVVGALLAQHPSGTQQVPVWVALVSALSVMAGGLVLPSPIAGASGAAAPLTESGGRTWRCAVLLTAPAMVAALCWSREPFRTNHAFILVSSSWAVLLWLGGILAALIVARRPATGRSATPDELTLRCAVMQWRAGGTLNRIRPRPIGTTFRSPFILEALALTAILCLALALRLWHLDSVPYGIWFDEVDSAADAIGLWHLPFQPFAVGNYGHNPSLYFYVMAVLLHVFGNTLASIRLTSALFGTLAVLAIYLLGRRTGGVALGLCAAALLALSHWALTFSRVGMPDIAAPAMVGLGLAAFCGAMLRPRAFTFALSGVLLGLSLMTYQGAFLPAGVALAVAAGRMRLDEAYRREAWPAAILLPLALLVGALPLLVASRLDPVYATARVSSVSLSHEYGDWAHFLPALGRNVQRYALMFTAAGDRNGRHNLSGAPMLDMVTGACLLLGLGICLRRIRHWFNALLLLWLGASVLGGILSLDGEAPQGARTIGAIAPASLIAALPLALLVQAAWQVGCRRARPLAVTDLGERRRLPLAMAGGAVLLPLCVVGALNIASYFVLQTNSLASWTAMGGDRTVVGRAVPPLLRQGYTVRVDPVLTGDPLLQEPVVRYAAGGIALETFDVNRPVTEPVPLGGLALIIGADSRDVYDRVIGEARHATVRVLAPSFDPGNPVAFVVLVGGSARR